MMKVAALREFLGALAQQRSLSLDSADDLKRLLTELQRHDDMSLREFTTLLSRITAPASQPPDQDARAEETVAALRSVFNDDDAFRSEIKRLQGDRKITRETLNLAFQKLTGRTRKLASKATKAKLAQDIADFRLERVRSERAAEMFAAKPIHAE